MKQYNKVSIILCLLIIVLLCAACQGRNPKNTAAGSMQGLNNSQQIEYTLNTGQVMARGENGYYFIVGDFLFFAESDMSKVTPLCNKPDCLHYNETDPQRIINCNAYIGKTSSIGWQDGNLYLVSSMISASDDVSSSVLIKVSPDGSGREAVLKFDNFTTCITLHNGYVYYVENYYDAAGTSVCNLLRRSLRNLKESELIYKCSLEDASINYLMCVDDKAYFTEFSPSKMVYKAIMVDVNTAVATRLFTDSDDVLPSFCANRNALYCNLFPFLAGEENGNYEQYSLSGERIGTFVEGVPTTQKLIVDETNYYLIDLGWKIDTIPKDGLYMEVYDLESHEKLASVSLNNIGKNPDILPGDDQFLFAYSFEPEEISIYYLDKSSLQKKTPTFKELLSLPTRIIQPSLVIKDGEE